MSISAAQALEFIQQNDVKFIRLAFCDLFGVQKNIAILSSQMERALERGVPFDASAIPGFGELAEGDLLLFPDPDTVALLPWRPAQDRVARFYCGIRKRDGEPFAGDSRLLLAKAARRAEEAGYSVLLGTECEFYLFTTDENGRPTLTPQDRAGYLDVAPADRGENIRREICLTLEEMGIAPESSHHERGPGQNEIDFRPAPPLRAVDDHISLRVAVKAIAARNGLYPSFLPKPLAEDWGSGLHLNFSLSRGGGDLLAGLSGGSRPEGAAFLAGMLRRLPELSLLLNPLPGSYRRLGGLGMSATAAWSSRDRTLPLRLSELPGAPGRLEVRTPDPACNPYFAAALLLSAGLEGVADGLPLPRPRAGTRLPGGMGEALELARGSSLLKEVLTGPVVEAFLHHKTRQWEEYRHAQNQQKWELERFFMTV